MPPAGIVLAAGESRRMGGAAKPLLPFRGTTFLEAVVGTLRAAGVGDVVVVLGARADEVRRALDLSGVRAVLNADWAEGMHASLRAGLRALPPEAPGALVTLVDLPAVRPATVRALLEAAARDPGRIVRPVHAGRRGHPVVFPRALFETLLEEDHPDGPRGVIRAHADLLLEIPVDDPGCVADVDTPEAYRALIGEG